jgi:hypothetical protein
MSRCCFCEKTENLFVVDCRVGNYLSLSPRVDDNTGGELILTTVGDKFIARKWVCFTCMFKCRFGTLLKKLVLVADNDTIQLEDHYQIAAWYESRGPKKDMVLHGIMQYGLLK